MERTRNTIRNIIWGTINKLITVLIPFVIRTVIIKILGSEYLGLNSLFTSILQILNLTELGISSAIVYCMYKPIAENDSKTICALMNLCKKWYRVIGVIILVLGLLILPFLNYFISGEIPQDINIYILYLIYLLNTVISYILFAYKNTLLIAFQRNDISSNVNSVLYIIQSIIQIVLLFALKNYYFYIIIMPFITIINNIVCAIIAKKKYPQYISKGKVNTEIKKELKEKISGLLVYRICTVTRNSFDSIFISAFLGLNMVAIYNNYYLIMSAVITFLGVITSSMLSGTGNSIATETVEKNYNDMNKFNFIYMWISGWCAICLLCLYQPFMEIWLGKSYLMNFECIILLSIYFYSLEIGAIRAVYADATGLWWESRYRAIIEAICNLALNYVLGKLWGLPGIIIATLISLLLINFIYGSQIIFKYYFKKYKVTEYFKYHLKYFIVTLLIAVLTYIICNVIHIYGIIGLIVKILICIAIPNILYIIIYRKNIFYNEFKNLIKGVLKKR